MGIFWNELDSVLAFSRFVCGYFVGSTPWKNLLLIQTEGLGHGDKPDYFMLKGSIMKIRNKDNALYMACPEDGCNKKVIDQGNQTYRCEKCNKDQFGFKWRLMLQVRRRFRSFFPPG